MLANVVVEVGITLAYARSKGIAAAFALGASIVALAVTSLVGG